jgi:hypothetical protein
VISDLLPGDHPILVRNLNVQDAGANRGGDDDAKFDAISIARISQLRQAEFSPSWLQLRF